MVWLLQGKEREKGMGARRAVKRGGARGGKRVGDSPEDTPEKRNRLSVAGVRGERESNSGFEQFVVKLSNLNWDQKVY